MQLTVKGFVLICVNPRRLNVVNRGFPLPDVVAHVAAAKLKLCSRFRNYIFDAGKHLKNQIACS